MALFAQPPTDPKVNSYATLDQANAFLATRLYTDAWDNASESPGAREYVVDGAGLSPGDTVIPVKDGKGDWTNGNTLTFVDPGPVVPVYTIVGTFAEPVTSITIAAPGLSPGRLAHTTPSAIPHRRTAPSALTRLPKSGSSG